MQAQAAQFPLGVVEQRQSLQERGREDPRFMRRLHEGRMGGRHGANKMQNGWHVTLLR